MATPSRRSEPRQAFTLLELLVVIAIIGMLTGLILAAVQKTRMAGMRVRCLNNLRQIGLAHQAYHDTHRAFPPGTRSASGDYPFMNWHTRLLPYLEQQPLWARAVAAYKQTPDYFKNPPHPRDVPVAAFACPVDPLASSVAEYSGVPVALTSYLGVQGLSILRRNGILFVDSAVASNGVTDGTSNTLLVGERPPSDDGLFGWSYAAGGQVSDGSGDSVLGVRELNACFLRPQCPGGPYDFGPGRSQNPCDVFHFWSLHSGGAHFLFADGSVRFLSYSAAPLLPALASRAGGETFNLPD